MKPGEPAGSEEVSDKDRGVNESAVTRRRGRKLSSANTPSLGARMDVSHVSGAVKERNYRGASVAMAAAIQLNHFY